MWEGIYLGLGLPLLATIVLAILLQYTPIQTHPAAKAILFCAVGGIAGSWVYSMKIYVTAITGGLWKQDQVAWRLASPFSGIFLAVSTYATIQTGLLGVTFSGKNADQNYYAYAIGFLVGLFSDEVMGKLTEVAKTLFGTRRRA